MDSILQEKLKRLVIDSQERCKLVENPDEFIREHIEYSKKTYDMVRSTLHKRWFESNKSFQKRLKSFDNSRSSAIKSHTNYIKEQVKKALIPVYVYYKGTKTLVPDSFYSSFDKADTVTFLEYLEEEDKRKNIITDEDREKARLLNCSLDYVYLQTLMNMTVGNPDLVITVQTKDGGVVTLRTNKKLEPDVLENEVYVKPTLVR